MESRVTTGTLLALACSAVMALAAPQQTNPSTGAPPGAGATERERARQTETISGCVQQGASAKAFVLASAPGSAPAAGAGGGASAHPPQHATWELLPDSKTDLSKLVGKRVEVTGMAVIGPTGAEPSRAPGNAGVTRFTVKTIKPIAGSC
jgi:hypothetical protein